MNRVEDFLKRHGPLIFGELARLFEQTYCTSNEATCKAISRAKSPCKKIG